MKSWLFTIVVTGSYTQQFYIILIMKENNISSKLIYILNYHVRSVLGVAIHSSQYITEIWNCEDFN